MIEQKGLIMRLGEEVTRAATELARDPRGFVRDLFSSDIKDNKRRRRIIAGLTLALVTHAALLAVIVYAGWHRFMDRPASGDKREVITMVLPGYTPADSLPNTNGTGGGGGGQNGLREPSRGVPPQMSPLPQIVKANAPSAPLPSLPVPPTIVGQTSMPAPSDATLGVPDGKLGEPPAPGPGSGGGIGSGNGTGVGSGTGPGAGRGSGGNRGGSTPGSPEGTNGAISGPINWTDITSKRIPNATDVVFIRRPTPVVTPEAQANKVSGVVLLRATFHADGRISDIQVISPVNYMTESAIESLERSTFRPATVNGVAVTVRNVIVKVRVNAESRN